MATPISVANWFIHRLTNPDSGDNVTHLKVQKLLYFAQAWHLMLLERPLFEEGMQAWAHGPVVPSVFHVFKGLGWEALPVDGAAEGIDEESEEILEQVVDIYGDYSAKRLEQMTHAEDPWKLTRGDLPPEARCEEPIKLELIRDYYLRTYAEALNGQKAAQGSH
ncbi:Panacea domain-containing protein [Paraburkholderia aspalathi]|uniref:Uncharacterized phage-associated protein n=1 Tax=Paraburkholderia aspalathi TaxID=1324617 RepID=A0A1I7CM54_9BURK|nr:type II toxin-antitoxin system antitoxin SocA domain-containing protein [Paraburkholderia aspalathi]SFU00449.1 Uncharacterized phage-associated protein [Paraburkholderia aspalathi]